MKVDAFNPAVREPDAAAGSLMSELTFTQVRRKSQRQDSAECRREHRQTQSQAWLLHTAITAEPNITSSGDTTTAGAATQPQTRSTSGPCSVLRRMPMSTTRRTFVKTT